MELGEANLENGDGGGDENGVHGKHTCEEGFSAGFRRVKQGDGEAESCDVRWPRVQLR
jgi:hypothetical protein